MVRPVNTEGEPKILGPRPAWRDPVRVAMAAIGASAIVWLAHPIVFASNEPKPATELDEAERRRIFQAFLEAEPAALARARERFPGDGWSIDDDRAAFERDVARAVAESKNLPLSQVYWIIDEGIRNHWASPDGGTLSATVPPLRPRR